VKGEKVRLWEDTWCGTSPLAQQFFELYVLCNEQNNTVQPIGMAVILGSHVGGTFLLPIGNNSMRWRVLLLAAFSLMILMQQRRILHIISLCCC
jgi:hypothetical protein